MFKQAVFYFTALLIIILIGFWPSYYSKFFGDITFGQHFHGISMTLWILLLISQAWMMRTGKNKIHKKTGKISFVLGPIVIIAAFYVAFDFIAKVPTPHAEPVLAIHWFGLFLACLFTWLYSMAIYHREKPLLHARYMISTAMVFLIPGLGRATGIVADAIGVPAPDFFLVMSIPAVIGLVLWYQDRGKALTAKPFAFFTAAWVFNLFMYKLLPGYQWWVDFSLWSATVMA
jgi:hypothetical protein